MIPYIIQVAAFQLVFLMIYDAFLKKETFFNWNRIYLLATALLSVVIPFIRLEVLKNTLPQQYIINLPEVIIGNAPTSQNAIQLETVIIESRSFWTWENVLYAGIIIATLLFVFKIVKVILMLIKNPKSKLGNLLIINLLNSNAAFSFFNYIFLGDHLNEKDKDAILKHEMVHVKEKHTFDLLFFEAMRILFWFNPLVYMYQNRIMTLHEFIADQEAVKHQDKSHYYQNLLSQVFQTQKISFINPFFKQSLIKKRIVMLQKSKSKQVHLLKYALLIPIVFGMLIYTSSFAQDKQSAIKNNNKDNLEQLTYRVNPIIVNSESSKLLEAKEAERKQVDFLKLNQNYVVWVDFDLKTNEFIYSIHSVNEEIPDNYEFINASSPSGFSYKMYANKIYKNVNNKSKEENIIEVEDVEVPFAIIEHVPIFPGCENLSSNEEKKKCMSDKIFKLVGENFNTKIAEENSLIGRQRITVMFKIDTEGNIMDVQSRAPHPALEAEAIRVINSFPKMQPGEHKGKKVVVPYSLPIVFVVADDETSKLKESANVGYSDEDEVPFTVIEQVPVFPGCEDLASNDEKKKCTSNGITEFVGKNFNTNIASENGLVGRQRITTMFKIDIEGNIVEILSRAPHPVLEAEATRVIELLPKMQPGKQRGEAVVVPYSLPIVFVVQGDEPELEKK